MKALVDTLNTIMAFSMIVILVSFPALKDWAQLRPGSTIHTADIIIERTDPGTE